MIHTGVDAIRALSWETVGIQDPVGNQRKVLNGDIQCALASAFLGQLEDLGADIKEHCRRLRSRQYTAVPKIEVEPFYSIPNP